MYSYSAYDAHHQARAVARNLPISTKHSIEVCTYLRRKPLLLAKKLLLEVIAMKRAVPYRRFTWDLAHRRGHMGPGRYPIKCSQELYDLLCAVESNAQFKGLNSGNLYLLHFSAQRGPQRSHYGRKRSRLFKNTTIEVVVGEKKKGAKTGAVATGEQAKTRVSPEKTVSASTRKKSSPHKAPVHDHQGDKKHD